VVRAADDSRRTIVTSSRAAERATDVAGVQGCDQRTLAVRFEGAPVQGT
jgi:hypothetical protein